VVVAGLVDAGAVEALGGSTGSGAVAFGTESCDPVVPLPPPPPPPPLPVPPPVPPPAGEEDDEEDDEEGEDVEAVLTSRAD
jgi:hypothetical protein